MDKIERMIQLVPANGWFAEMEHPDGNYFEPLAFWALVEYEDGTQCTEGYIADGEQFPERAEVHINFVAYRGPSMKK